MFFGRMGRAGRRCRMGRPFNSFYYKMCIRDSANTVAGSGADKALAFRYTVQLQDETGAPYTGTVGYEGTGTVADGQNGTARPDAQGCLTICLLYTSLRI